MHACSGWPAPGSPHSRPQASFSPTLLGQRIDRTLAEFDCCLPAAAFFLISVWLLFDYGFACKDARQGPYNDPSTSSRPPVGVVTYSTHTAAGRKSTH
jgi:hypothetical protein